MDDNISKVLTVVENGFEGTTTSNQQHIKEASFQNKISEIHDICFREDDAYVAVRVQEYDARRMKSYKEQKMKPGGTKLFAVSAKVMQKIQAAALEDEKTNDIGAKDIGMDVLFPCSAHMEDYFFQFMLKQIFDDESIFLPKDRDRFKLWRVQGDLVRGLPLRIFGYTRSGKGKASKDSNGDDKNLAKSSLDKLKDECYPAFKGQSLSKDFFNQIYWNDSSKCLRAKPQVSGRKVSKLDMYAHKVRELLENHHFKPLITGNADLLSLTLIIDEMEKKQVSKEQTKKEIVDQAKESRLQEKREAAQSRMREDAREAQAKEQREERAKAERIERIERFKKFIGRIKDAANADQKASSEAPKVSSFQKDNILGEIKAIKDSDRKDYLKLGILEALHLYLEPMTNYKSYRPKKELPNVNVLKETLLCIQQFHRDLFSQDDNTRTKLMEDSKICAALHYLHTCQDETSAIASTINMMMTVWNPKSSNRGKNLLIRQNSNEKMATDVLTHKSLLFKAQPNPKAKEQSEKNDRLKQKEKAKAKTLRDEKKAKKRKDVAAKRDNASADKKKAREQKESEIAEKKKVRMSTKAAATAAGQGRAKKRAGAGGAPLLDGDAVATLRAASALQRDRDASAATSSRKCQKANTEHDGPKKEK